MLRKWLDYCDPYEGPDSYWIFSLLSVVAAAINGRILVNPGGEPSPFTNTYTVLYGPSGARKSTSIIHSTELLSESVPETPIIPSSFTMESLVSDLARRGAEHREGKASGFFATHELSSLIGGPKYRHDNSKILSELWDCKPYLRNTQTHKLELIEKPYLVHLAASSPDWLESTDPQTLAGGYLRRLLIVNEYGKKRLNARPVRDVAKFMAVAAMFKSRISPGSFGATSMQLSERAHRAQDEWYGGYVQKAWEKASEREGHFWSCSQAHALKLAAAISVLEGWGLDKLDEGAVRIAQQLIEAVVPPMFQAYASLVPTQFARLRAAIVRTIRSVGGEMSEFELFRAISQSAGVSRKEVMPAIASLVEQKTVTKRGDKYKC